MEIWRGVLMAETTSAGVSTNNNTGAKAFGGVLLIVALIAGMYAMFEPINKTIDNLKDDVVQIERFLSDDNERKRLDAERFAAMQERFKEVETQFKDQTRRIRKLEEWKKWWEKCMPEKVAIQGEKIKQIEKNMDRIVEGVK